ncbi:adenylate/guanylate cyclase domain-containing protein [Leptospira idonii]
MIDLAALKRGSEKTITAFFSDVAGFSTISEQLKSQDLAALLNEYLSAMTIILKEHDGVLDKYIGDAIVGIFNAPVDVSEHPLKAGKASIEMVRKLKDLRQYWIKNDLYTQEAREMDARIGLNTGPAKVGFMGTDALASYTMMGDTVNLAARLEAAGKDYGVNILISESTKALVDQELFTRELDLVRVKGKNEPVRLYELIASHSDIDPILKESAEAYEKGFELYLKKNFSKAIAKLNEAVKIKSQKFGKDKAALMLIERCEEYKQTPPEKNWDGVFTRTHK